MKKIFTFFFLQNIAHRKTALFVFFICLFSVGRADRIYLINTPGYNTADPTLINAIMSLGHTVIVSNNGSALSSGSFTSRCVDPVNGYDWLCFFGNSDFSVWTAEIKNFIDAGGKVFCQYEVGCCLVSSASVATVLSSITGLPVTTTTPALIAGPTVSSTLPPYPPQWEAVHCCLTFRGAAYKGLSGVPLANQFVASTNLNGSLPLVSTCPNFGFFFNTTDFLGTAQKGAITGLGDVNVWYDGDEPPNGGGASPVNMTLVNYFFPNTSSSCYLVPPGCMETYINPSPVPDATLISDTVLCNQSSLQLNVNSGANTILWNTGASDNSITITQSGTYWVMLTNGACSDRDTVAVEFYTASADLGPDQVVCGIASLNLSPLVSSSVMGAPTFLWSTGTSETSETVSASGVYWVDVSWGATCTRRDSVSVLLSQGPQPDLGSDTAACALSDFSLLLDAGTYPSANYLWSTGDTTQTILAQSQGVYWVNVTIAACSDRDTITVRSFHGVELGSDRSMCGLESVRLNAALTRNLPSGYLWSTGQTASYIDVPGPGVYVVVVTQGQCVSIDSVTVKGSLGDGIVYVPNAFTPGPGDLNDVFYVVGEAVTRFHLAVYNRWGERVFESHRQSDGWDGTHMGKPVEQGSYVWILQYSTDCSEGTEVQKSGSILLIR
ncbi:MAG: hypothetical protein K0S33_95 [Bacteroidetes bacterium]|jgi:gliding motility-associated-like protein|nr:hypothetical protein [Bacteroidota bacterium]